MRIPFAILHLLCVGALFATALSSQEPSKALEAAKLKDSAPTADASTGGVTGSVLCSDTRKPARGAYVLLLSAAKPGVRPNPDEEGYSTVVGLDGTYRFEHVAPGNYLVSADLRGYLSDHLQRYHRAMDSSAVSDSFSEKTFIQPRVITVHSDETVSADLVLERGSALSGHVSFSDGSPAVDASIIIEDADTKPPKRIVTQLMGDQADDRGGFRIVGLPSGRYLVSAVPRFTMAVVLGLHPHGFTTAVYSPQTFHQKAAKVYEVHVGEEVGGVDITVPISLLHRVGGKLASTDGRTPNMGSLTLIDPTDEAISYSVKVGEDGAFLFLNIPPGTYKLTSKDVFIGVPTPNVKETRNDDLSLKPIHAFAGADIAVVVSDSDIVDLTITSDEVSLPPQKEDEEGSDSAGGRMG